MCARRQTVQKKGDVGQAAIAGATRGRWRRLGRKGGGRWAQLLFLPERQEGKHGRSTWRGARTAEAAARPDWLRGESERLSTCLLSPSLLAGLHRRLLTRTRPCLTRLPALFLLPSVPPGEKVVAGHRFSDLSWAGREVPSKRARGAGSRSSEDQRPCFSLSSRGLEKRRCHVNVEKR